MDCSDLSHAQCCACGSLRKTTRAITQFFDRHLQPIGLRSTQCSLLLAVSLQGSLSVSELGDHLLMDQTTVTRNIEILRKHGYVSVSKDEQDARRKSIAITDSGAQKLMQAMPLLQQAQAKIEQGLGEKDMQNFLRLLKQIEKIVE